MSEKFVGEIKAAAARSQGKVDVQITGGLVTIHTDEIQKLLDAQRVQIANWLLLEANHGEYDGWEDIRHLGLRLRDNPETVY